MDEEKKRKETSEGSCFVHFGIYKRKFNVYSSIDMKRVLSLPHP